MTTPSNPPSNIWFDPTAYVVHARNPEFQGQRLGVEFIKGEARVADHQLARRLMTDHFCTVEPEPPVFFDTLPNLGANIPPTKYGDVNIRHMFTSVECDPDVGRVLTQFGLLQFIPHDFEGRLGWADIADDVQAFCQKRPERYEDVLAILAAREHSDSNEPVEDDGAVSREALS